MPPLERVATSSRRRREDRQSPRRRQRLDENNSYLEDSNEARDSFDTAEDGYVHPETVSEEEFYEYDTVE